MMIARNCASPSACSMPVGPREAQAPHRGYTARTHKVILEAEIALRRRHDGAHGIVAHRQDARADAKTPGSIGGEGTQAFARCQAPGAFYVQSQVAVAQPEPGLAPEGFEHAHEGPGLVVSAPAAIRTRETRERVERGVQVGRNPQAEMCEIIARIDDHRQGARREHALQAEAEFGAADSAGQRHDGSGAR
jgi:hypothetical protein